MARFLDSTASIKKEAGKKSKKKKEQKKAASKPQSSSAPKKNYTSNAAKNIVNNTVGGAKKTTKKIGQTASKQKSKSTVDRLSTKYGGGSTRSSQISSQSREKRNNRINTRPRKNEALSRNPRMQDTSVTPTRRQASEMQERARQQRPRTAREEQAARQAQKMGISTYNRATGKAESPLERKDRKMAEQAVTTAKRIAAEYGTTATDILRSANTGFSTKEFNMDAKEVNRRLKASEQARGQASKLYDKLGKVQDRLALEDEERKKGESKLFRGILGAEDSGIGMVSDWAAGRLFGGRWEVPLAIRSYGGAVHQAEKEGASRGEARLNALLNAGIEIGTEHLAGLYGGLGKLTKGGKAAKGITERAEEMLTRGIGSKLGKDLAGFGFRTAADTLGEIGEEWIANPLENLGSNLIYGNRVQKENEKKYRDPLTRMSEEIQTRYMQDPVSRDRFISTLNDPSYKQNLIDDYVSGGMSKKQAESLANTIIDMQASAAMNDKEGLAKQREDAVRMLAGDVRKKVFDWDDMLETTLSTALLTAPLGIASNAGTAAQGAMIRDSKGGRDKIMSALKKQMALDPENSDKAKSMLEAMEADESYTPSGTQVYDIMQGESAVMRVAVQNQQTANRMKQKGMRRENLMASPSVQLPDGSYVVTGEATAKRFAQDYSETRDYMDTVNAMWNTTMDEDTEKRTATSVASFKTGSLTAAEIFPLTLGTEHSEEARYVFSAMTGVDLDQYNVYDKNGKLNVPKSNGAMQQALFAMSADNYMQSARIEQENWNDQARGVAVEKATTGMGIEGDKAMQTVLQTVDPRDKNKFNLTANAASEVYNWAVNTEGDWDEIRQTMKSVYPTLDASALEDVFEAGKRDRIIADTPFYGRTVQIGQAMDAISKGDAKPVIRGKFINKSSVIPKASTAELFQTLADSLNIDIVLVNDLSTKDENGVVTGSAEGQYIDGQIILSANLDEARAIHYVLSHELTHHLETYAPSEYQELMSYVRDKWYRQDPQGYEEAIAARKERYKGRQELTDEGALSEIIADASNEFWGDEEFVTELCNDNPNLAKKILDAINEILRKIRDILAKGIRSPESNRALYSELEMYDEAKRLWLNAYNEAKKNAAAVSIARWDQNAWTKDKESETRYNEKETRHSLGYHAGDLGKSTVDDYYNQGYGRGTGHFGFGTYFVGNPDRIKNYNKRNGEDAPVETVDFDKYNLFKPRDFDRGIALHDALKLVDGYITDYSKFTKYDKTSDEYMENLLDNTSRINRAAENLVDDYEWNDYQWDDSTQENKAKVDKYIADYLSDYDRSEIESKAQKEYDKVQSQSVDEEAVRKELADNYDKFKNTTDFWGNPFIRDESEEAYIERNLQDTIDIRNRDKDVPYDYYYYKAAQDAIKDNTENWEFKNRKLNWLSSDLMDALNYRHSKEEIENALRKTGEIVSEYVPEGQPRMQAERGLDSAATVFMKQLGYEGVDVRHINELDTTGFGSVIYDLKDEDLERKQEIGTARFSLSEPVERDNDLVAIHNLPEWKLKATLKLGGFPMPSIAVTNKNHTNFGEISLLFNSDTIDPQKDKENKVYSADAWTPTVPSTDYESDHKVVNRVFNTVRDLIEDDEHYRSSSSGYLHYSSIEDALKNRKGFDGLIDYMMEKPFMQYAYLKSKGEDFEIPQKDVKETKDWKEERVDRYNDMLEKFGGEDGLMDLLKIPMKELFEREDVKSYISENLVKMKDGRERPGKFAQKLFTTLAAEAVVYNMDPDKTFSTKTVNDYSEADRQLAKRIDKDEMRSWLKDLFDGIIADSGVYNGKDPFTPAGKSRTFKQLHYPATAEGIVQAMKAQGEKNISNVTTTKTLRADLSKSFKSLADIRSRKDKLHDLSEEEVEKIYDELDEKFMEIISGIAKDSPNSSNDLFEYDYIGNNISECAQLGYTKPEQIIKKLKEYGYVVTEDNAKKTLLLFDAIREMPVNMFEAKPRRVVGFREIKAAIVPDNVDPEIRSELELLEVPIYDYASGDDAERVDKVNQAATDQDIRFSIAENYDDAYMDAVNAGDMEEAQKLVDEAARHAGMRMAHRYHGTMNAGFTVFDKAYAKVGGNSGAGFYFSTEEDDSINHYQDVEGADNYFKWSSLAEHINQQIEDGEWEGPEFETYEDVEEYAKNQLNANPGTYDVYLNYQNPYIRDGSNSTNLYDMLTDEFDESAIDRADYEDDWEYDDAVWDARSEHVGEAIYNAVYGAYQDMEDNYEILYMPTIDEIISRISEYAFDGSLTWKEIKDAIISAGDVEVTNPDWTDYGAATPEFTRAIIENLGFDAIEDKEVSKKFGQLSREMMTDTEHIIVFKPEQIKLSDPVTYAEDGSVIPLSERFDPNNNDIRYSLPTQDSDGNVLTNGQMEYFKNSQARDENGRLQVVYHTTNRGGFTVFDPSYSDDNRSLFFASNFAVSQTYGRGAFDPINLNTEPFTSWEGLVNAANEAFKDYPEWDANKSFEENTHLKLRKGSEDADISIEDWMKMPREEQINSDYYVEMQLPYLGNPEFDWHELEYYDSKTMMLDLNSLMGKGKTEQRGYYSVYLNLENPLIVDAHGANWNAIPYGESNESIEDYAHDHIDFVSIEWEYDNDGMPTAVSITVEGEYKDPNTGEWETFEGGDRLENIEYDYEDPLEVRAMMTGDLMAHWYAAYGFDENVLYDIIQKYSDTDGNVEASLEDLYFDEDGNRLDPDDYNMTYRTRQLAEIAENKGRDGVIIRNCRDIGGASSLKGDSMSDIFIAFSAEQIKDIRNENPTENPDIRWSIPEDDEVNSRIAYENSISDSYDLVMQYETSAAMGETDAWLSGQAWLAGINEEDLNEFYAGLNDDEAVPFSDPVLEEDRVRMAKSKSDFYAHLNAKWQDRWTTEGELLDIKSVRKDIKELVTGVMANSDTTAKYRNDIVNKTLFDIRTAYQLSKQGRADIVSALLYHSAQRMIDGVEFYIDDTFDEYKQLRDYLKVTKISLGEEYWEDVDYDAFRKRNFGRIKLVKGNTNVDQVYQELCNQFPQWFNEEEEMNPADQLLQIEYVLDKVQPYKEAYSSEAAAELAFEVADSLYDIMEGGEEYKSLADTYKERAEDTKQRHAEAMQAERAKWRAKEERRKERFDAKTKAMKQRHAEAMLRMRQQDDMEIKALGEYYERKLEEQQDLSDAEIARLREEYETKLRVQGAKADFEYALLRENRDFVIGQLRAEKRNAVRQARENWRLRQAELEEKKKEKAEHTKRFDQLKNNYDWLTERLLNPTKEKNIPEQLRKPLAELLQLFDFQTERSKSLEDKYGKVARKTLKMRELKDKLTAVCAEDDSGELPFNSWLQGTMEQLAEQLDGAPIDSLNSQDIRLINEVLTTIIHGIRNRQNLIAKEKQETIAKYGDGTIAAMDSRMEKYGPRKQFQGKALQWLETLVNEGMETASYFFGRIDPNNTGIGALYKDLERGEDKYIENTAFLKRRMREITGKYMNRKRPGSKVEEWRKASNAIEFNLESGETISLTPAQIMSIYCLNKRPQAQDHLYVGGIATTPASVGSVLQSFKRKAQKVSAARVTPTDVKNMITKLTPEQIQVADQLQSLMSNEMSDWGNETSMQMYGIKMFKEKEYFPLKVSREVLPNDLDKVAGDTNEKIRNFGFTKPLTPNAQNAVYIDDIFAVAADHCNKMALYNAMAIPIMNFNRVYNYKQKHDDGSVSTVQEKIGDAFTNKANAYIKTFLSDLNGNTQTRSDATEALVKIALSNYKKAAIGLNGRVALQQVTALPRAFMEINPKYFAGTVFTPAAMRDMFEHCPKALWKSWGNYEMDLGRDMEDVMMNKDWSRLDVIEMGLYGLLDNYTWTKIWQAVKKETKAKHKDVEYESQEFYDLCNERARDIFNRTQVVDSLFNRSAEMRSKSLTTKMLTSFKAEPTLTYNVFRNALVNGAEKMRDGDIAGGAATFGKAAAVLTLCAAYTSAMAALWDAVRRKGADDDEDKKFSELWWLNFLDNFFNDNAPWKQWNNIYFISDAIQLKEGWGTSFMALEGVEKFWKGYNDLIKKLHGEGKKSWYDVTEELATGIGYIIGAPAKTVMSDVRNTLKWFGIDVFAADGTVNETIDKAVGGLIDKTKSLDLSEGPDLGDKLKHLFSGYDPETEAFVVNRPVEDDTDYGKLEDKAAEIANSTKLGTERNSELWSALTNGYTKSLADADFERIDKLRAIYKANGGDVDIWDEKIMKACKTAYKKTLIADATSADLNRQDAIREYMTNHGVTDAEISDLCYRSDTAKDLKAAMRLNNEDLMVDEMVTLMNAGISDEDLIKLYDNRNRGRDTYDGKYKDLFKSTGTYKWPINGSITSNFGHRSSPGGIGSTYHQGLDIAGNMGDPVGASDGGTVIFAGWYGGAGKTVKIEHDDGTITQYSHLSWWGVKEGDVVGQGQTIGNVGSTGNSTGPHLHFGVIKDGSYVNPREYLSE